MALSIQIQGLVQGVGFRPFVWHLANELCIKGSIWNNAEGVVIHAWGNKTALKHFQQQMIAQLPPLARIDQIETVPLDCIASPSTFSIGASCNDGDSSASLTPDAATCPHCLSDIFNLDNRHHHYAFTSCSYCGPRLSITYSSPYDRINTSMAAFSMCQQCQSEYSAPADRRFHAQTNACPACGPQLTLEDASRNRLNASDRSSKQIISNAALLLQAGHIVAIKGISGIHLAVDADNHDAVVRLRARKHRYGKAFALMAGDIQSISHYTEVGAAEVRLLNSTAAPVVLLERKLNGRQLSKAIAPGQSRLGFMLPYSPLHHLLMSHLNHPIVLTSGNRSNEPQCITNNDARQHLTAIADYFLLDDREIVNRLDDSVAIIMHHKPRLLRRARGYAPAPLRLHESFASAAPILAMGGELKSTFCQLRGAQAIVSQHLGDLEHSETHHDYRHTLALYEKTFAFKAAVIAVDRHPDYFSARLGEQMSHSTETALLAVQHHHAHVAAVLAEHRMPTDSDKVLGIVLDGAGFGNDGTIWGGEFLLANYTSFTRLGCFQPVAMPGGTQAIKEPWRNTLAHLHALDWQQIKISFGDTNIVRFLGTKPLALFHSMIDQRLNAPLTSSCGRLFDAVAAALGICLNGSSYEGQAAIELESLAKQQFKCDISTYAYHIESSQRHDKSLMQINWQPMWHALLGDIKSGVANNTIAARFHRTIIAAVYELAMQLCRKHEVECIVLCGGAFQNKLLLETLAYDFQQAGYKLLIAEQLPINDGGLSLGQAAIAAATQIKGMG